jgi:hypothetical protein
MLVDYSLRRILLRGNTSTVPSTVPHVRQDSPLETWNLKVHKLTNAETSGNTKSWLITFSRVVVTEKQTIAGDRSPKHPTKTRHNSRHEGSKFPVTRAPLYFSQPPQERASISPPTLTSISHRIAISLCATQYCANYLLNIESGATRHFFESEPTALQRKRYV